MTWRLFRKSKPIENSDESRIQVLEDGSYFIASEHIFDDEEASEELLDELDEVFDLSQSNP